MRDMTRMCFLSVTTEGQGTPNFCILQQHQDRLYRGSGLELLTKMAERLRNKSAACDLLNNTRTAFTGAVDWNCSLKWRKD